MQGGFSFCGTDIADLGLEYVPENANTYVFAGSDYKTHEQAFDAHDGGYFYGITTGIKVFTLRCIFQNQHINEGILSNVENFFRKGKSGRLIFQKRPWLYYVATVTDINVQSITNYLNGIVTIQMKAYYPYARCDRLFYSDDDKNIDNIIANSSMLPETMRFETNIINDGSILSSQIQIPLFNGGTQSAPLAIEIAGDIGEGVIISNKTTNQKMSIVGLTKEITSNTNRYLLCDSLSGQVVLTDGQTAEDAYLYHDYGYISLSPNVAEGRSSIFEAYPTGGYISIPKGTNIRKDCLVGKYIYCDKQWRNIVASTNVDGDTRISVSPTLTGSNSSGTMPIVDVNEIVVTPVSTMSLTKLNFLYKPTFN